MINRRLLLRVAVLCAVGVLAFSYRVEISQAFLELAELDLIVLLVLPLYVVWNWIASLAWLDLHKILTTGAPPSVWRLFIIRLQAQAVNLVVPSGSVGGEVVRVSLLSRHKSQLAGTTSAVVLDKIADGVSGVAFSLFGVLLALGHEVDRTLIILLGVGLLGSVVGLPLVVRRMGSYLRQSDSKLATSLTPILDTPGLVSTGFYRALGWHILERVLNAGEIYLAMLAVGLDIGVVDAIFVAAVMTAYGLVFFFVPGQVGAHEAGVVAAFGTLGLPATTGLTVALVRRGRQLILIGVGTLVFFFCERKTPVSRAPAASETEPCE